MTLHPARPILAALLFLASAASAADGLFPKGSGESGFLPVDRAFELQPLEYRDGALQVSWRVTPGYYLYRDRLKFTLVQPAGGRLGAPVLPQAEAHHDEHFGATYVFRQEKLAVQVPVAGAAAPPFTLTVVYQGCAEAGLCYPPQTRTLEVLR